MKHFRSILLCLCFFILAGFANKSVARADEYWNTEYSKYYNAYRISLRKQIDADVIEVPEEIEEGKVYSVEIRSDKLKENQKVKLPDTIQSFTVEGAEVLFNDTNPYLVEVNGGIYCKESGFNKAGEYLYHVQPGVEHMVVQEGTNSMNNCYSEDLKTLELPKSVQFISLDSQRFPNLENVIVAKENPYFFMDNGFLYGYYMVGGLHRDKTVCKWIPSNVSGKVEFRTDCIRIDVKWLPKQPIEELVLPYGYKKTIDILDFDKYTMGENYFKKITVLSYDCELVCEYSSLLSREMVLSGWDNSTTHEFAKKYNLKFESLGKTDYILGQVSENEYSIRGYVGEDTDTIVFPSEYQGKKIVAVGLEENALYKKIVISEGITTILKDGFAGMELESIEFPSTLTSIGDSAFSETKLPQNFKLPDSVQDIGAYAFYKAELPEGFILPTSIVSIGYDAFYCSNLSGSLTIPASVKEIGAWAFGATEVTDLTINCVDTQIYEGAFAGMHALKTVNLPDGLSVISDRMFLHCDALTAITIPESVKTIEYGAFAGCTKLMSVIIPEGLECIEQAAFSIGDHYRGNPWMTLYVLNKDCKIEEYNQGKGVKTIVYTSMDAINNVRAFVERMYTVALGRNSDAAGKEDWSNQLLTLQRDGAGIAQGFLLSTEFLNKNLNNEAFVDVLYHTFFDRDPDEGGRANWLAELAGGADRNVVIAGFVNSQEFTNLCESFGIKRGNYDAGGNASGVRGFVLRLYNKVLGRKGEEAGISDWVNRIETRQTTPEEAALGFFGSQEFIQKNLSNEDYVEILYQSFMDRASDEGGKADWVGRLNSGVDRTTVLQGFSRSEEFGNIIKSYGL